MVALPHPVDYGSKASGNPEVLGPFVEAEQFPFHFSNAGSICGLHFTRGTMLASNTGHRPTSAI